MDDQIEAARRRHPSWRAQHHMADWPIRVTYRRGLLSVERVCCHDLGHPDPDWMPTSSPKPHALHACDGCCM
jgi:hypothetical protein